MKNNCQNLPGITEIRVLPAASLLPFLMEKSLAGIPIAVLDAAADVRFFGDASCVTEQVDDHNGRLETATLTFSCLVEVPATGHAYLIRQASGQWWLLGTKELQPQVTKEYSTSAPGEKSVYTVTATLKAQKALLPVAV
ncbi:MAG: hypothetical protein IJM66_11580 [Muribaculaceae bacterium]|nr:hypothetical protein [Muribaculaceae bacterium]MBQ6649473.1 hypothetical protein [Muribaculaceae bacterium]